MSDSNQLLQRRGFDLGRVSAQTANTSSDPLSNWHSGKPVLLRDYCSSDLESFTQDISQSEQLVSAILDDCECEPMFDHAPYQARLTEVFQSIGGSVNEGDDQEIETLNFDAIKQDEIVAHDLWMKISWLSFHELDASLRFRFSFGEEFAEDVAADAVRQDYAAQLCNAVFPESCLISKNHKLTDLLCKLLGSSAVKFVERIVYFNAPHGGAYFHHDRERGHAGVVYCQLTGQTLWLALSKSSLMQEIQSFAQRCQNQSWPDCIGVKEQAIISDLVDKPDSLSHELETFSNNALVHLINQCSEFISQLQSNGHSRLLNPGDIILLPQKGETDCCWHSVMCVGEEIGQALSFAIRGD